MIEVLYDPPQATNSQRCSLCSDPFLFALKGPEERQPRRKIIFLCRRCAREAARLIEGEPL